MKRLSLSLAAVLAAACGSSTPNPTITVFTASPSTITLGSSTTLVFQVDPEGAKVTIDNGVGDVSHTNQATVSPSADTIYTLTAVSNGQTVTLRTTVTVTASPSAGFKVAQNTSAALVAGAAVQYDVTALDIAGNTNPNYRGTVHVTSDDAQAVLPADFAFAASDAGKRTIAVTFKTAGARSLIVADTAQASAQGVARPSVAPAAASTLVASGVPSSSAAGVQLPVTVTALDAYGNVATGYTGTVHFASNNAGALLPADYAFTAADKGTHSFAASFTAASSTSLTISDTGGGLTGANANVAIGHAAAKAITLAGLPSEITVDASTTLTVTILDGYANTVTDYAGTVHFTVSDAAATAIPDVNFTAAMHGTAQVSTTFATAATQSISATDTGATITGATVTKVKHGTAVAFALSGLPSASIAGEPLSVTVTALDSHGNVASTYAGTVHFSSNNASARLPADYTFTSGDAGQHAFGTSFTTAGASTLTATEAGGTATGSASTTVGHAAASKVTLQGVPASVNVDTTVTVTTTVRDAFGNPITDYTGTLHFVLSDSAAPAVPDVTFTASMHGTADVTVSFATAGDQSIIATDTANASITCSTSTRVVAGAAFAYTLTALPIASIAGEPLTLTVNAVDSHGNLVTAYAGSAHFSSTDSTDRLPADGAFSNGSRTVSLSFVTAGDHFAHVSEVSGSIAADTSHVQVASGDAAALALSGGSSTAGTATTTTVTAKDTYGNQVSSYAGTVTLTSDDTGTGVVMPAAHTFTSGDAGQFTFSFTLVTAGARTVTASDGSITGNAGFTVSSAAATKCIMVDLPASSGAGAVVGMRVIARDQFDNTDANYRGTMAVTSTDSSASLGGNGTFDATDAGSHAFSIQLRTAGTQTVTATDTANGSIFCSQQSNVQAGATILALAFQGLSPANDAWAGTAVSVTVTAQDAFANRIAYTGTVHFTSSDALATLPANVTFVAGDNGQKTVNVTFATVGAQTFTGTDTVNAAINGTTALAAVHGLVYTNPSSGGKVRLISNSVSNASVVQLDLVSNASLFALTLGTNDTVRNGAFAAGMNLPLDSTKVGPDSTLLVTTVPATVPASTAVLNLGSGVQAKGAALNATNGVLYSGISQKRVDPTAGAGANNARGDVAVRPFPGGNSFYYSLRLKLTAGATPGVVFDGQSLSNKFHAAVRDRSGSDVFAGQDFAIGKLEVK